MSLFIKLKFLEKHDFNLLSRITHRELRNAIVHQDYVFDSRGNVKILRNNKQYDVRKLSNILNDMNTITFLFFKYVRSHET